MPDLEPTPTPATNGPAANGTPARPKPKGLLPVPPEVLARVAAHLDQMPFAVTPDARQRSINTATLQYHYGGDIVAFRELPQGVEVLASGEEIGALLREVRPDGGETIVIGHPAPWCSSHESDCFIPDGTG